MPTRKTTSWVAVALSALAIVVATTFPSGETTRTWSFNLTSGDAALAELIQNLLLFIPLGAALALAGIRPLRAIALGAALSFSVEFLQQWIPGRDPSVGDIVCNTTSTAIGVALVRFAPRWLLTPPRQSAWQSLGTALIAVLVWTATGIVLRPAFPPLPYHQVNTPDFNYWGHYKGRVVSTHYVGGALAVKVVAAPAPPGRSSPLVAILDRRDEKVVILAVDGHDLALRYDMPALHLRFEQPDLRWRDALAQVAPRDTFVAGTMHDGDNVCLVLNDTRRCNLGYTVGDGWKLIFFPEHFPAWLLVVINGLWVAGCVFGVGFWAARTAAKGRIAVAIALVALIIVPWLTGLKGTSLVEWIGALGGIELGLIVGTRTLQLKS